MLCAKSVGSCIQQCNTILILSSTEPIIIQVGFVIFCYSYLPITISSPVDCDPVHAEDSRIVTGSWKTGSPHLQGHTASSVACSPLGLLFATYSFSYNAAMHTLPKYCIWADHLSLTPLVSSPVLYNLFQSARKLWRIVPDILL